MRFCEEKIIDTLEEAKPLLMKHWKEVAFYKDIELNPDYDLYFKMEQMGMTRLYIARDDCNVMVGYSLYVVRHSLHYKQCVVATEDIIFVDPERRGVGMYLLKFADDELRKIGVQVVSHHIKFSHDWSKSLERLGYEKQDMILTKRLDR